MNSKLDERWQFAGSGLLAMHGIPEVVPINDAVRNHTSEVYWDWRKSFESDPLATPLQHPDLVLAELASTSGESTQKPVLVRGGIGRGKNSYAILIPKTIRTSQMGGVGPDWKLQGLRLAGGRILGNTDSAELQKHILKAAASYATKASADFLLIEDLNESTPLFDVVYDQSAHGCLLFVTHDFQRRHYIDFPATEAEYANSVSSHSRKLFRRALKKCPHAQLERITGVDQIPGFLDSAHEISRHSWQSNQFGMRIRNDEKEMRQLTSLAANGLLRSYVFRIDGTPVAFAIGNQHVNSFRYEETAFHPEFRHFSPGRTMLQLIIEDLLRHDSPKTFDFGFGDAEYKQQFGNRESRSGTLWLVPPGLRARLALTHLNVCRQFRSAVYTRIRQSSLGTIARQWLRSPAVVQVTREKAGSESD